MLSAGFQAILGARFKLAAQQWTIFVNRTAAVPQTAFQCDAIAARFIASHESPITTRTGRAIGFRQNDQLRRALETISIIAHQPDVESRAAGAAGLTVVLADCSRIRIRHCIAFYARFLPSLSTS